MSEKIEARPVINVTPMIDILLVLLIIFMAISPLKPSSFKTKIPDESKKEKDSTNINSLTISINSDLSLSLNGEKDLGTLSEPQKLMARLSDTFQKRMENGVYAEGLESRNDLTEFEKIQKTVFIKAPRKLTYFEVAKVVDAVKQSGAYPIGLQIDDLE